MNMLNMTYATITFLILAGMDGTYEQGPESVCHEECNHQGFKIDRRMYIAVERLLVGSAKMCKQPQGGKAKEICMGRFKVGHCY